MTLQEQNKLTVARFNREFIQGGDMAAFNEIIAPDLVNHTAPPGSPRGPEGVLYFFNTVLKSAFPDLSVEILDQVAEGDKVSTRKAFHATHKGEFNGIPATGKSVTLYVHDLIRLRDGKFIEHWGIADMAGLMRQLQE